MGKADVSQSPVPNGPPAAQFWTGVPNSTDSVLVTNSDLNNTVFVGTRPQISPGALNVIPVQPNASLTLAADRSWWVVGSVAGIGNLLVIPGGLATFLGLTQGLGQLVIPQIKSPNYVPGVSGWAIFKNGNVEFNSGTFRGTVSAGTIIGSTIESASLAPGVKIDPSGNIIVFNSFGAIVFYVSPSKDGWFVYADTGSATQGALLASVVGKAGVDPVNGVTTLNGSSTYQVVGGTSFGINFNTGTSAEPGMTVHNFTNPSTGVDPSFTANTSGGTPNKADATMSSGQAVPADVAAFVQASSANESGFTNGEVILQAGEILAGVSNSLIVDDNNGLINLANSKASVVQPALGASLGVDASGIIRGRSNVNGDGNTLAVGALTNSLSGTQLISSTTPTQITNFSWNILAGVRYRFDMMLTWTGAGTTGSANFGFNGSSVSTQQSVFFWTQGPTSGTGTGGLFSSPTLVTTRQGLFYTALVVCTTTGAFNVRAQISTGGSNFTINNSYGTLTPT